MRHLLVRWTLSKVSLYFSLDPVLVSCVFTPKGKSYLQTCGLRLRCVWYLQCAGCPRRVLEYGGPQMGVLKDLWLCREVLPGEGVRVRRSLRCTVEVRDGRCVPSTDK